MQLKPSTSLNANELELQPDEDALLPVGSRENLLDVVTRDREPKFSPSRTAFVGARRNDLGFDSGGTQTCDSPFQLGNGPFHDNDGI